MVVPVIEDLLILLWFESDGSTRSVIVGIWTPPRNWAVRAAQLAPLRCSQFAATRVCCPTSKVPGSVEVHDSPAHRDRHRRGAVADFHRPRANRPPSPLQARPPG